MILLIFMGFIVFFFYGLYSDFIDFYGLYSDFIVFFIYCIFLWAL